MNELRDRINEAYTVFDREYRKKQLTIAIKLGLILFPAFALLDWYIYPEQLQDFLKIRLLVSFTLSCILLIPLLLRKYVTITGLLSAYTPCLAICVMIYQVGGALTPYYAGLLLVFVFISVIVPMRFVESLIVISGSIVIYIITCIRYAQANDMSEHFYYANLINNLFFLISTGIIISVGSYYQSLQRKENFRLNYELDLKNKELAELDRMKSEFFANISHELRTPLTLILGPLQDLLKSPAILTDHVASLLHTARDNGLRLLKLVNDLLDLMRFEEEGGKLELKAVEITSLLEGLIDSVRHMAESRNIALSINLDLPPVHVAADHETLERVFLNLLSNSLKFTDKDGYIDVSGILENGSVLVTVADSGIGISEDDLPFIFDRFHQADSSTTRKYTGTGIGLSLVKQLIENLKGEIDVKSELGKGTKMFVRLPLWQDELGVEDDSQSLDGDSLENMHGLAERLSVGTMDDPECSYPVSEDAGLHDHEVLLVEDEVAMRRYLNNFLSEKYRVIQAKDGLQGLEAARKYRPQLMVLDLMLPKIDGLEVCRLLKEDPETRNIKIVLLTARVDDEAKLIALRNGADDFLIKPFSRLELETRLKNLLFTSLLEKDLVDRNNSLEKTLEVLKVTQSQLIHSEKLNAIGSLSAGLLHEINNPLNYALTAIHILKIDEDLAKYADFTDTIEDIEEGMERIRTIVSDLRAFAYPSEAEKKSKFSFNDSLEKALRFTASELKRIDVEKNLDEKQHVRGSQSHIVQILINLFSNAAKSILESTKKEPGKIVISTEVKDNKLIIKVIDNGIGMDNETLNRIFEPFFTTRDVGEGVGMGLSICHTIVKNHGGELKALSTLGEGATFLFDLPLAT